MLQTFSQQAEELWRFLEQEIFSQPFTAATALHWLEEQLHKGMSFNALSFLLLFPLCALLYYLLPRAAQMPWLLICSYLFYWYASYSGGSAHPQALVVLVLLTAITWLLGLAISRNRRRSQRRVLLVVGILAHLLMLLYVKYTAFFASLLNDWFDWSLKGSPALSPVWMVGLSFYTLIAIGYLIDLYRGTRPAEKNPLHCALLLSFFPQVVSGPIARSGLLDQMKQPHRYDEKQVSQGLRQMLWGYFKKIVISENAAAILAPAFALPQKYGSFHLVFSALLYTVQLYADFSGYSDIALGAARCLGFTLQENFRRPYGARSIGEFWDRWHISLSSWFQNYLYIPLGGSRRGVARTCCNTLIVFLVSGLWHGAGLTFLVWGLLHGIYNIVGRLTKPLRMTINRATRLVKHPALHHLIQRIITFCLVSFAWIFFRAETLESAFTLINRIGPDFWTTLFNRSALVSALTNIGFYSNNGVPLLIAIAVMFFAESLGGRFPLSKQVGKFPFVLRWAGYYLLLLSILFFGVFDATPFIYGQF